MPKDSQTSRRAFLHLSALAITGAALAACGATPTATPVPPTATKPAAPAAPTAAPPTATKAPAPTAVPPTATAKATVVFGWYGAEDLQAIMKTHIAGFQAANPTITVDMQIQPMTTYFEKLPVSFAGGTAPDVFFLVSGQVQNFASMGGCLPLGDVIPAEKLKAFRPAQIKLCTYQGKVLALPFTATIVTPFINKGFFQKAGVTAPTTYKDAWTWEDAAANLKKVKDANNLVYAMLNGTRDFWYLPWLYGNGAVLVNEALDKAAINTPEAEEALTFLQGLTKDKIIAPPGEPNDLFYQSKAAVMSDGHWGIKAISQNVKGAFEIGVMFFPKRKAPALGLGGDYLAAYDRSKVKDAAVKWLNYLTDKEVLTDYCSRNNYIPPREDIAPNYGDFTYVLELAQAQAKEMGAPLMTLHRGLPQYEKIRQAFQAEYDLVMLGQKTPKDALKAMETGINAALGK